MGNTEQLSILLRPARPELFKPLRAEVTLSCGCGHMRGSGQPVTEQQACSVVPEFGLICCCKCKFAMPGYVVRQSIRRLFARMRVKVVECN